MLDLTPVAGAETMGKNDLIGTEEAAGIIGVTQRHVQYLCEEGILAHKIVSGSYLIKRSVVEAYRDNRPKPGPKPKSGN